MRAENVPQLLVPAFADEVEVHLAEGRQPAVGIVDLVGLIAVRDLEPVVGRQAVNDCAEHPTVMQSFQFERLALDDRRHLAGFRPQGADNRAPVGSRVGAEQTVRIMMRSTDEAVEGVALDRCHGRDRARS